MSQRRKNRTLLLLLIILVFLNLQDTLACDNCKGDSCIAASVTFNISKSTISADTLFNLINSNSSLCLIECRAITQKKDIKIPGARIIKDNDSIDKIRKKLPATSTLIILYPGLKGGKVASLSSFLKEAGYQSIIEFQSGIHGWITYGYKPEEN